MAYSYIFDMQGRTLKRKTGFALGAALLTGAVTVQAQSTTNETPPTPPVLTCNQNSITPGVFKDLKDVFTTAAKGNTYVAGTVSHTYTNSNQGYWQIGVEKRAAPGGNGRTDGTTGSRNNAGPTLGSTIPNSPPGTDPIGGFYDPYPTLPTMDGGWVVLGNNATSGYNQNGNNWQLVGMNAGFQLNRNPNVMYYYKFTFTMDPLMDLSKFSINIPAANGQWGADDRIKGIYVNGQLVGTTNDPATSKNNNVISTNGKLSFSTTSSAYTAGLNVGGQGSLPTNASWAANNPNPIWKTGINEVVFATMNGGVRDATNITDVNFADSTANNAAGGYPGSNSGMNTSLTLLKILGASPVQDCTVPPPTVSAPNPIPVSTSADPLVFTGTVSNYGSATTVNVTVKDASGTVVGTFPAQIDPATGT